MLKEKASRYKLFLSLALFLMLTVPTLAETIELKIWVDKNSYLTREAIFINYEIKNLSDSLLFMNFIEINEYFKIKDEKGNSYNPLGGGFYIHGDSLKPYQSHKAYVNIAGLYNITQPGVYTCYLQIPEGRFSPILA